MFVLRRFAIGCNVLKSSQEKSKTMVMPFLGGGGGKGGGPTRCLILYVEMMNKENL